MSDRKTIIDDQGDVLYELIPLKNDQEQIDEYVEKFYYPANMVDGESDRKDFVLACEKVFDQEKKLTQIEYFSNDAKTSNQKVFTKRNAGHDHARMFSEQAATFPQEPASIETVMQTIGRSIAVTALANVRAQVNKL